MRLVTHGERAATSYELMKQGEELRWELGQVASGGIVLD